MSLYLKYRPQSFDSLVGQDQVSTILKNAITKQMVSHACLFCGPRGTGKTSTARLLAKAVNCTERSDGAEPCNRCEMCIEITKGSLTDVIEIDAASNRGIDEMRELRETIKFAPSRAKNKIYIIDEVHMLTGEAFNALLKTLEEPPENVFFILATTEVHKIPQTILSRCQRFDFKRIDSETMFKRLCQIAESEKIEFEEEAMRLIAEHTDGGLRDAISLLDQLSVSGKILVESTKALVGSVGSSTLNKFLDCLMQGDDKNCFVQIQTAYDQGYDLKQFQSDLLKSLHKRLNQAVVNGDRQTQSELVCLTDILMSHQEIYRNSLIPQLSLEVLVVKFCGRNQPVSSPKPAVAKTVKVPQEAVVAEAVAPAVAPVVKEAVIEKVVTETVVETVTEVAVAEEVTADKNPVKSDMGDLGSIDFQKHWKQLLGKVNKPMLRRSLEQGKIESAEPGVMHIEFDSEFHFSAVNTTENLKLVEEMFFDLTKQKTMVKLKQVSPKDKEIVPEKVSVETKKSEAPELATEIDDKDLAGFFDGEYI